MQKEHTIRRPVAARRALEQRQKTLAMGILLALGLAGILALLLVGCGSVSSTQMLPPPVAAVQPLQVADVQNIVQAAVSSVNVDMVVAIVDRAGFVLGVFRTQNAPATAVGNFGQSVDANDVAVSLARTAAFFSNDQAPLSSRTVRFISGIHFPPGVTNAANAPLYGIENTNRGCTLSTHYLAGQSIPPPLSISGTQPGLGVATGKADVDDSDPNAVNPGGVPIFKDGHAVGGIGIAGVAADVAEYAGFAAIAANGFAPNPAPPGVVIIGGVSLPFVNQTTLPSGVSTGTFSGSFVMGPTASPGAPPDTYLVAAAAGPIGGLSSADVNQIITN